MKYINKTGLNLVEILEFSDSQYQNFKAGITQKVVLCKVFDKAKEWIRHEKLGSNCVRYLLYMLNNRIIKMQLSDKENYRMETVVT